jgi:uncharacterized OB-fold protein
MSDQPQPTRAEPMPAGPVSAPFWDATREQRLVLQWCVACDAVVHYPRDRCPRCLGDALEWRDASGDATVYACSVMNEPGNPLMAGREPYVVALVDLREGARFLTNIVECAPGEVRIGAAVRIAWEPLSDGRNLPVFVLAGGGD